MRSNSKHTAKELGVYIQLYINGGISYRKLCEKHGLLLAQSKFHDKVLRYQEHGLSGIQSSMTNNRYSKGFKHSVVIKHLEEGDSIKALARKYNIPSDSTVRNWIIKYTKGESLITHSSQHVADNVLNREFQSEYDAMEVLLTDVTEFKYDSHSKAYLSAILDYGTNKIVAYKLSTRNNNKLVHDTVTQIEDSILRTKTLLHSDRGFQYTSHFFKKFIEDHQII